MKKFISTILSASVILSLSTLSAFADSFLKGDINGDGKVSSADALLVQRHTVGLTKLNDVQQASADYNNDGKITNVDALLILRSTINLNVPMLYLPSEITINCGDRTTLNPKVINGSDKGLTYTYTFDGAVSDDGTGEPVLEVSYASGLVKGYHLGTDHVVVKASNGLTAECNVTVVNNKTEKIIHVGEHTLKSTKEIMIYNDCYSETYDFDNILGLVVHSTAEPGIKADQWYSMWNKGGTPACVHAFLDDEGVYQYLPFEQTAWHAGIPVNDTRIDFEICEPAGFEYDKNWNITKYNTEEQQKYFDKIWENATVYAAYLAYTYDFDTDQIISHYEAGQMGIGTKHNDPDHWFIFHNKTMDDFRNDVEQLLNEEIYETEETIIGSLE